MPERGYLLPSDPDVAETVCITVRVPDAPEYIAAFWGSLDYLTTWLAWERDADHGGAVAAGRWRAAINQSRQDYLDTVYTLGGSCMLLRQDPTDCRLLQWSGDGGQTWQTFADISCVASTPPPVYTGWTDDGRKPSEAEADDLLWWLNDILTTIDDLLDTGTPIADIKATIQQNILDDIGVNAGDPISDLVDEMAGMTDQQRNDSTDPNNWSTGRDDIICGTGDTYFTDHRNWLDKLTDELFAWLNGWTGNLFTTLGLAAAALISFITGEDTAIIGLASHAAAGGGAGFGYDGGVACGAWSYAVDFEQFAGRFTPASDQYGGGRWVAGPGWQNVPPARYVSLLTESWPQPVTLTRIEWNTQKDPGSGGAGSGSSLYNGLAIGDPVIMSSSGGINEVWTGSLQSSGLRLHAYEFTGYTMTQKRILIEGEGFNPFT